MTRLEALEWWYTNHKDKETAIYHKEINKEVLPYHVEMSDMGLLTGYWIYDKESRPSKWMVHLSDFGKVYCKELFN